MSQAPVSNPADEAALVARARRGDLEAFDQLVLRHQQQVFAVALRMLGDPDEAREAAQDAFVRAFRGLGGFRQEAKWSTWLVSITMHGCRNRRRALARQRGVIAASLDDPVGAGEQTVADTVSDPAPSPSAAAERHEQQERVLAALQRLDEDDRVAIVLRDIQGHAYEEIADILKLPLGTVKSRLSRARDALRKLLGAF
jgi:RNA polymerase sigma-70 factor (ECF subfamily)